MKSVNTPSVRRRLLIVAGISFIATVGLILLIRITNSCEGLGCIGLIYIGLFIVTPLFLLSLYLVLLSFFLRFYGDPSLAKRLLGTSAVILIGIFLTIALLRYLFN